MILSLSIYIGPYGTMTSKPDLADFGRFEFSNFFQN